MKKFFYGAEKRQGRSDVHILIDTVAKQDCSGEMMGILSGIA